MIIFRRKYCIWSWNPIVGKLTTPENIMHSTLMDASYHYWPSSASRNDLHHPATASPPLTSPCPLGTFPASAFGVLVWGFAATTKTCTGGHSARHHLQDSVADLHASFSPWRRVSPRRRSIGNTLQHYPVYHDIMIELLLSISTSPGTFLISLSMRFSTPSLH